MIVTKKVYELIAIIQEKRMCMLSDRSMLVAVSGIDGSGKGYITGKIVAELNKQGSQAVVINIHPWLAPPQKRFSKNKPAEHFYYHAFDFNNLFQQLIFPFQKNRSIDLKVLLTGQFGMPFTQVYDFQNIDIIILEGIFLLTRSLKKNYDLTFWMDCSFETALERALQRNQENLPSELIVRDYHTIYFPAQRFHMAIDEPILTVDAIYLNDFRLES